MQIRNQLPLLVSWIALAPFAAGQCPDPVQLTGSDTVPGDRFGAAVALAEDVLLVGASFENGQRGSAYVLEFSNGTWTEVAKLEPSAPPTVAPDRFGSAVATNGRLAIVGAPTYGTSIGAAYLFERNGSQWDEVKVFHSPIPIGNPAFGTSVAISGGQIFIGRQRGVSSDPHAVHIYEEVGGTWVEVDRIVPADDAELFGRSIEIDGSRAIVGAAGQSFIFDRIAGSWVQQAQFFAPEAGDTSFGYDVAIDRDHAVVGAFNADTFRGMAVVLAKDAQTGRWVEQAELSPSDGELDDRFGLAVDLSGNRAFVSSPQTDGIGPNAGAVYVFRRTGERWTEVEKRLPLPPAANQGFGYSLDVKNDRIAVASVLYGEQVTVEGLEVGASYCSANVNSTGAAAFLRAAGSCDVLENDIELEALSLPPHQFGYFLLSQAQAFVANPGGSQGNLCLGGTIGRFQAQVQNAGPDGVMLLEVDLSAVPLFGSILAGETWNFQCWYRDLGGTSNFTDGVEIPFR